MTGGKIREVMGHAFFRVYIVLPRIPTDGLPSEGDVIVGANGKLLENTEVDFVARASRVSLGFERQGRNRRSRRTSG